MPELENVLTELINRIKDQRPSHTRAQYIGKGSRHGLYSGSGLKVLSFAHTLFPYIINIHDIETGV